MERYISNPTGNLVSYCDGNGTQDGHGGRAREHHEEMRQIAREEIEKVIPQIQQDAYAHALSDVLGALRADVTTVVDIAMNTGEEIFHDARTKQTLLDSIYKTVLDNLGTQYTIK